MSEIQIDILKLKQKRIEQFEEILKIVQTNENNKKLWREIYTNAITDRAHAESLLNILVSISSSNSAEHAIHSKSMSSYIERMSKANDQLIKLTEMISDNIDDSGPTKDEIYEQISN